LINSLIISKHYSVTISGSLLQYFYSNKNIFYQAKAATFAASYFKILSMNKGDLIEVIAEETGITKVQANAVLDSFTNAVAKALKKGDKVTLVGFGTFIVSKHKARMGRNPKTKEPIKIKARNVARFKAGKELTAKL
jgi:DNA-binding protein HU-beta